MLRRCVYLLLALGGCQDKSSPVTTPAPAEVLVLDSNGGKLAELKVTRPCRVTIGPQELIVGGPPLLSSVGSTTWNGETLSNGTTLIRNGERIARVFPVGETTGAAVFDLKGVAQVRVTVAGQTATVEDKASIPVRRLTLAAGTITADDPAMTITGTDDLVLAALLSAPELLPEVRMLAACERVLLRDSKGLASPDRAALPKGSAENGLKK